MSIVAECQIHGAMLTRLDHAASMAWLAWLTGEGPPPADQRAVRFALAHCHAGVTWGYLDGAVWRLGSEIDPEQCPSPTADSLHELRLFGATAEVLIWRDDDAQLSGRILADDRRDFNPSDPLRPMDEPRCLRGKAAVEKLAGFTRYVDAGGAQHLAPESFPPNFGVRHYLEQDPSTGAARIAATRLVSEKL